MAKNVTKLILAATRQRFIGTNRNECAAMDSFDTHVYRKLPGDTI